MKRSASSIYLGIGVLYLSFSLAHVAYAMGGVRQGNCWTDYNGTNHCGNDNSGPTRRTYTRPPPTQKEINSAKADALDKIGYQYYLHGQYQAAIEKYNAALQYEPGNNGIRQNLLNTEAAQASRDGNRYFANHQYAMALSKYREALQYTPGDSAVLRSIHVAQAAIICTAGNDFYNNGQFEAAIKKYNEALQYTPHAAWLHRTLRQAHAALLNTAGDKFYKSGQYSAAAKKFRGALRYTPHSANILRNLRLAEAERDRQAGDQAYANGDLRKAIKLYHAASRKLPNDSNIRESLANARRKFRDQRLEKKSTAEAKRRIDQLQSAVASMRVGESSNHKASRRSHTKNSAARTGAFFGISGHPDASRLGFMKPEKRVAPGRDRKAGDQLKAAANRLTFKGLRASFDQGGGKSVGSLDAVHIGGEAPVTSMRREIAALPPQLKQRLQKDPEYQRWNRDIEKADTDLKTITKQVEAKQKEVDSASEAKKANLQIDLAKLKNQQQTDQNVEASAVANIKAKVHNLKFHQQQVE